MKDITHVKLKLKASTYSMGIERLLDKSERHTL